MGRRMMISISKTKNRTASRKNRKEKGRRALDSGLNPHSKGALVSRSLKGVGWVRLNREEIIKIRVGIINVNSISGRMVIIRLGLERLAFC